MSGRKWWSLTLCLLVCVAIIFGFQHVRYKSIADSPEENSVSNVESGTTEKDPIMLAPSPFATVGDTQHTDATVGATTESSADASIVSNSSTTLELWPDVDVFNLGRTGISDEDFQDLAARMNADPDFLQTVINEFRLETDNDRLQRLARLLGDVNAPEVTALASEMIFSGDADSRTIGLALLKHIQPGNAEARSVVSGLLTTEYEADVLVETLTAISIPGTVDDEARAGMSEQVAVLATHTDAAVRRSSINILSRWSDSTSHTPIILNGLQDDDRYVRQASAYALVGHEDQSNEVIQSLLAVAANSNEVERVRRGAVLALKGMVVDEEVQSQVTDIERQLNTRQR